jgi:hypothetical protein
MLSKIKNLISQNRFLYLRLRKPIDFFRFYKRDFSPPVPTFIKHKTIKKNLIKDSVFIETGTLYGDTILTLHKNFSECYTIEASDLYFEIAKNNFKNLKNVTILKGKSINILPEVIEMLKTKTKNLTFYLDAHYSSFGTYKDNKLSAVEEELNYIQTILNDFKFVTIIIDDLRCFGKDENYPTLQYLFDWAKKNNSSTIIENDTFIIKKL